MNRERHPIASRPMAFVSDIHGNAEALEAVLTELGHREVEALYAAGDLLYGGQAPMQVWQRLQQLKAHCVRGLSEVALATVDPAGLKPSTDEQRDKAAQFTRTREQLGDLVVERLRRLPENLRIPLVDGQEILMVHGSPSDPNEEMSQDMEDEELRNRLGNEAADIVVCGASHVPFQRRVDDVQIVNVGSVGQAPEGRIAHFTIITPRLEGAHVEQSWVEY
jgi:predicted phosphodiesterase